jgi:hypothetical protein
MSAPLRADATSEWREARDWVETARRKPAPAPFKQPKPQPKPITEREVRIAAHEAGLRLLRNNRYAGPYVHGPKYKLLAWEDWVPELDYGVEVVWCGNTLEGALGWLRANVLAGCNNRNDSGD